MGIFQILNFQGVSIWQKVRFTVPSLFPISCKHHPTVSEDQLSSDHHHAYLHLPTIQLLTEWMVLQTPYEEQYKFMDI